MPNFDGFLSIARGFLNGGLLISRILKDEVLLILALDLYTEGKPEKWS